jgi:hypothetical protein
LSDVLERPQAKETVDYSYVPLQLLVAAKELLDRADVCPDPSLREQLTRLAAERYEFGRDAHFVRVREMTSLPSEPTVKEFKCYLDRLYPTLNPIVDPC